MFTAYKDPSNEDIHLGNTKMSKNLLYMYIYTLKVQTNSAK